MLFSLEADTGDVIQGYLVPDGFSEKARIRIVDDGKEILVQDCDKHHEAVVSTGRHSTGVIGFRLTNETVPDLANRRRIAIFDQKTGLLIYRRPMRDPIVRKRVFRLENRLVPFQRLDKALDSHFQYAISGVERFGHETTLQAFLLNAIDSIYISGRLLVRNYEQFMEKSFTFMTMLNEPYLNMAEQIFLFHRFAEVPSTAIGERDRMIISPAVEHFTDLDITSEKQLRRALRNANDQVRRNLFSPFTRQMVATYPEQMVSRPSIAAAMDTLSRFGVIGVRDAPDTFTRPLAEFLQVDAGIFPSPTSHAAVAALAGRLRQIPEAEMLLELDLILYHFARDRIVSFRDDMGGP